MEHNEIPLPVQQFVTTRIPSIPHLEALLLLRATAPARWDAESLSRRLYISLPAATQILADLSKVAIFGYSETDGRFYFLAQDEALVGVVQQLGALYATRLVEITLLVHSGRDRPSCVET